MCKLNYLHIFTAAITVPFDHIIVIFAIISNNKPIKLVLPVFLTTSLTKWQGFKIEEY